MTFFNKEFRVQFATACGFFSWRLIGKWNFQVARNFFFQFHFITHKLEPIIFVFIFVVKQSPNNEGTGLNCRYVTGVQILRPRKMETSTQTSLNEDAYRNQWNNSRQEEIFLKNNDEFKHLSLDQLQRPLPQEAWEESGDDHAHYDTVVRCFVKKNSCLGDMSTRVDKASRILFPLSFMLYNIFYWVSYYNGIEILPYRL